MGVFVIAEAACTWRYGDELATAKRSIQAAKACGADAWKTQWCGDLAAMYKRRGHDPAGKRYDRLAWPREWLPKLKALCDEAGIEFMCTVFIPEDIPTIAEYVKRFKVSAFESTHPTFVDAHRYFRKAIIASTNVSCVGHQREDGVLQWLHCVSIYPTPLHECRIRLTKFVDGLSDHSTSLLTGAVAVGLGAKIIEHHFKLDETPNGDPDYPHSFVPSDLAQYIANIREAEKML